LSTYDIVFEATYYGLAAALTLVLASTILLGLKDRQRGADQASRNLALSTCLAALGASVSVFGGVGLDYLAKSGQIGWLEYFQVEFSVFYAGFALILAGVYLMAKSARQSDILRSPALHGRNLGAFVWIPFVLTVTLSSSYLFDSGTYWITFSNGVQHVAQQKIFYLPLVWTLAISAALPAIISLKSVDAVKRGHAKWFGLFAAVVSVGVLRETTIIPSSGDPLTDLLVSFVPFALGSFCLLIAAGKARQKFLDLRRH
jgi:hypothetical protein